jgi:RNA polymerase sigma-70 factor (ECF subfamily)
MPLDPRELAKLIEMHAATLQLWLGPRCASGEDVVQEAFCRLACQEPPPTNPAAWLYRVCRNLAEKQRLSDVRRRKREQARAGPEQARGGGADSLEIAEILGAVDELDDELREVLIARIWGQLSLEEVGALCGVSTATAYRRYEAALKVLRAKLTPNCENRR